MIGWDTLLTGTQLAQHWADCAKLDPRYAADSEAWYMTRTTAQLQVEARRAWLANARESYCLARSYLAM